MVRMRCGRPLALVTALVTLSVSGLPLLAQGRGDESAREEWQKVDAVFAAMGMRPGATVADVGAGDGFFTARLSKAAGPDGRVYAVDVSAGALGRLRRRLEREGLTNVTVVEGTPADPGLPDCSLDAVLIVNAYHEMREHQPMLAGIRRALKPGGRLVIIEPVSDDRRGHSRDAQTRNHEIAPAFVERDAREAGFTVVDLQDPFTHRRDDTEWLMVLTPGSPSDQGGFHLPLFASQPRWPGSR
jgi:predicted methyltransferase